MIRLFFALKGRANIVILTIIILTVLGCSKGGAGVFAIIAVVILGVIAPPVVPLVVFPGGEALKPAVLLPFSSEVHAIAMTPNGKKLYVADSLHNTVSVIKLSSRAVTAVLDVRTGPRYLAVTPDGSKVLVSSYGSHELGGDKLSIIDIASDNVSKTLTVGTKPFAIAIMPDSSKAFVLNSASNNISVIDLNNLTVSNTIDVAAGFVSTEPVAIVISKDGAQAYVVNRGSNDVAIINTRTELVVQTEAVGVTPTGLAMLPDGSRLYVSNRDDATISILNTSTGIVERTLPVSTGPMALVASMDGKRVYVAHAFSGNERDLCNKVSFLSRISAIDVASDVVLPGVVTVGDTPLAVAVTGDNKKLYTVSACADSTGKGTVSSLATANITGNANVVARSIKTVARGTGLVLSPDSFKLYVTHPHAVSELDVASDTLVGSPISVRGAGPTKLALTADGTKLYAINAGSDSVSVIDVDPAGNNGNFLSSLPLGSRPSDLAITTRPVNNQVIVTNAGFSRTPDTRISIIDVTGPGVVDDMVDMIELTDSSDPALTTTGRGPVAVAINSDNTKAFVANFGDFFPNSREPGFFLSQIDLQTLKVSNFDGYGDWLLSVSIDPDKGLDINGNVIEKANEDVIHAASFLDDTISRGIVSDPSINFGENIVQPVEVALSNSGMVVADYHPAHLNGVAHLNNVDRTTVVEVDLNGNQKKIQFSGTSPGKISVTPDKAAVFVLHSGDRSFICGAGVGAFCDIGNTVSVAALPLENPPVSFTLTVGKRPTDIAFTPDVVGVPKRAYVTNYFDGTVTVIDSWDLVQDPTVVATLVVGEGPGGVVINAQGTRAYVANSISNSISVIKIGVTDSVVGTIIVDP